MDKVELKYSTKNIPVQSRKEYKMSLIQKTKIFLRNLRWKAHFFLKPQNRALSKENYGFKSDKNAPPVNLMKNFEDDLISMVENVKFKTHSKFSCDFQKQLSKDVKNIEKNPKVIVKGDKTSNHYSVDKIEYQNVLHNTITKEYKKQQ